MEIKILNELRDSLVDKLIKWEDVKIEKVDSYTVTVVVSDYFHLSIWVEGDIEYMTQYNIGDIPYNTIDLGLKSRKKKDLIVIKNNILSNLSPKKIEKNIMELERQKSCIEESIKRYKSKLPLEDK